MCIREFSPRLRGFADEGHRRIDKDGRASASLAERPYWDWNAERTWEDDGGRAGAEPVTRTSSASHAGRREARLSADARQVRREGPGHHSIHRKGANVLTPERLAIVVTHLGASHRLVPMPWLETDAGVEQSDWIVLSRDGWRAVADGDPDVCAAFARRLLIGWHVGEPELILVVGHEVDEVRADDEEGTDDVRRIVRRVRSLFLPALTLGVWMNGDGTYRAVEGAGVREPLDARATLNLEPAA